MNLPDPPLEIQSSVAAFSIVAREVLDGPLSDEGFSFAGASQEKQRNPTFADVTYRSEDRYIQFKVNTHYRDAPTHGNVILGTGSGSFPEGDWNHIALWRLAEEQNAEAQAGWYELEGKTLRWFCERALLDLREHGRSFLQGDLTLFRRVRAEQTRQREGYSVWTPGELSEEARRFLQECAEMQAKYSREDAP